MAFNFFKTKKEGFFLVLDIGTEAVKTLICQKNNKKIIVFSASTQYFEKYGVFDGKDFDNEMIKKTILKAIREAYQNFILFSGKGNIKIKKEEWKEWQVLLGLPANILKGRIVCEFFKRENPKGKISKAEEENFFQQAFKGAQREISQRFAKESGILPDDIQWITKKSLEIKIDGYPVLRLAGYEGKNLELKIFATFLPKYYFDNIKRIFRDLQLNILKIFHRDCIFRS